ncbi:oxidoreductase [Corynebacterium yudongzhengii]|uniref:Oxidoreductase n=1 Tax=Corynebacterium yudongzhengii TaxID=2080740 RepID=A0A2U1T4C8_9CORY|nr:acryloyl-CoA reductase [Corynebacterium yudongzhengii]AWB83068.1 oxidoreductase [Corynebacterium yudongzhengii]PWC00859.1 oxidoreductase [Corynebacterium yudongzhengii]
MSTLQLSGETTEIIETRDEHAGEGDTLIDVTHSSLNYKDALAMRGEKTVALIDPLVPGIDAVGTTEDDRLVTVNGAGLGERRHGGYTPQLRIDAEHLVDVPERFNAFQAAAIGTAGFTAALCVLEIRDDLQTDAGPVLVTGASGGVGSVAVHLLKSLGYEVHALTGRREEQGDFLRGLGADEIVDRADFTEPGKPMQKGTYAGVVDTVGSTILANAIARLQFGGIATACGMAQGTDLNTSVLPFILRNVRLFGANSVDATHETRVRAWGLLDEALDTDVLASLTETISLADAPQAGRDLLAGRRHGRAVVDVRG